MESQIVAMPTMKAESAEPTPKTQHDFSTRVIASATATAFAESICVPLEVCKVRLQVGGQYSGFSVIQTFSKATQCGRVSQLNNSTVIWATKQTKTTMI